MNADKIISQPAKFVLILCDLMPDIARFVDGLLGELLHVIEA